MADRDTAPDAGPDTAPTPEKGATPDKGGAARRMLAGLAAAPDAARDPLDRMIEIFKDPDLTEEEKALLFRMSSERFLNRRRMAYISLWTIVGAVVYLGLLILIEGLGGGAGFSDSIKAHTDIIVWLGGFFTSVIAFYFGAATLRPSS
jgi:hypothetical protein